MAATQVMSITYIIVSDREMHQWIRDLAASPQNSGSVPYTHGGTWISATPISGIPTLFSDLHGFQKTHGAHKPI